MATTSPFDILFEPQKIGPVTAPNRFYQVPHCTGMGNLRPHYQAAMRGIKAEGGWGVVCTEYCSIHASSDDTPHLTASLWDDHDVRALAMMSDAVHQHGALAGVELWHGGTLAGNNHSRIPPLGSMSRPHFIDPIQSRTMDKEDISNLRRWHRQAAQRAVAADFDIVYVYLNHDYLMSEFLNPSRNKRHDDYGAGSRMRLAKEIIEETKEAVGHRCAVAVRYSLTGDLKSGALVHDDYCEILAELGNLPDLWDITVHEYNIEMGSSRYVKEAAQEQLMGFVRQVSNKPLVGVGRFTSPDVMVRQVSQGQLDFIGAARPSIADPFLPNKIRQGRINDIRECIGCNVCYAHNSRSAAIRCTQNPTMGEEWRRGWHPEQVPRAHGDELVLVIGGGPAGMEAAVTLGRRGYRVMLAEATRQLGGRVNGESQLPGLQEWARVRDWRLGQLQQLAQVEVFLQSPLTAQDALEVMADHIFVATGAKWRNDGIGIHRDDALHISNGATVLTPDQIIAGEIPTGKVVIFDDDVYYMSSVLALQLRKVGCEVTLITPHSLVGPWTQHTEELEHNHSQLLEQGVTLVFNQLVSSFDGQQVLSHCVFTGKEHCQPADHLLSVTGRIPNDELYFSLRDRLDKQKNGPRLQRIGDCDAPGIIAHAVYSGHAAARGLGGQEQRILREVTQL